MLTAYCPIQAHQCDQSIGKFLLEKLHEWSEIQPSFCREANPLSDVPNAVIYLLNLGRSTFPIAPCHNWVPNDRELSYLNYSVELAASQKQWMLAGVIESLDEGGANTYTARLFTATGLIEAECCNRVVAKLLVLLNAFEVD